MLRVLERRGVRVRDGAWLESNAEEGEGRVSEELRGVARLERSRIEAVGLAGETVQRRSESRSGAPDALWICRREFMINL